MTILNGNSFNKIQILVQTHATHMVSDKYINLHLLFYQTHDHMNI